MTEQLTATGSSSARFDAGFERLRVAARSGSGQHLYDSLFDHVDLVREYLLGVRVRTPGPAGSEGWWTGPELATAYIGDALHRFFHTLRLIPYQPSGRLLELGANPYFFSLLVRQLFDYEATYTNFFGDTSDAAARREEQQVRIEATGEERVFAYDSFNMELIDFPYPEGTFDVVLFCEVLEHLVLDPLKVLDRIHRVLKPGGRLVLTTPNAVRLANVAAMLAGSNFFDRYHPQNGPYGRHNREFTLEELRVLSEQHGFEVESLQTLDRYDYARAESWKDNYEAPARLQWNPRSLRRRLRLAGGTLDNRGDNLYLVARKR